MGGVCSTHDAVGDGVKFRREKSREEMENNIKVNFKVNEV